MNQRNALYTNYVATASFPQFLKERFKIDMPHRFKQHTFLGPTFCEMCGQLMHGIFRQQYKCEGNYITLCEYVKYCSRVLFFMDGETSICEFMNTCRKYSSRVLFCDFHFSYLFSVSWYTCLMLYSIPTGLIINAEQMEYTCNCLATLHTLI